jgi:hypothetical protein
MFTFRLILLCVIICNRVWCVKLVFRNSVRKGQVIQTPGAHMVSKLTSVSKFPGTQLNTITKTSPDYASQLHFQEICWFIYESKYWMTSSSSNMTIRQMRCFSIQLSTYWQRFRFELKWAIYLISSPSLSFSSSTTCIIFLDTQMKKDDLTLDDSTYTTLGEASPLLGRSTPSASQSKMSVIG